MPLKKGNSREVVSRNISELVKSGRDVKQAVAIALHHADQYKKYADGGDVTDDDSDNKDTKHQTLGQIIGFPGSEPTPKATKKPKGYADGGDVTDSEGATRPNGVTQEDLDTLKDMFGENSSSLTDALDQSRQQALQETLGQAPLSNDVMPPLANKSAEESAQSFGEPIPTEDTESAYQKLFGQADTMQNNLAPDLANKSAEESAKVLEGVPVQESEAATPAVTDASTSSVLGGLGDLASKASLPLTAAYEFLKSTPANAGEDKLIAKKYQDEAAAEGKPVPSLAQDAGSFPLPNGGLTGQALQDYIAQHPGPEATIGNNPNPGSGAPGAANGPSLFAMTSSAYQNKAQDLKQQVYDTLAARLKNSSNEKGTNPASAASNTPATSTTNPLVAQYLKDREDMKNAQALAAKNRLSAGLANAFGTLASSTYGANRPLDTAGFAALQKNANAPVEALQAVQEAGAKGLATQQALMSAQQQQQANDANSALSQQTRKVYEPILKQAGLPTAGIEQMSANQIKSYAQAPLEFIQKQKEIQAQKAMQLEMMKERMEIAQGNKQHQYLTQTAQQLEQLRGNPALQQAWRDKYAAAKANRLISQAPGGDPNNLSKGQVALLTSDVARIAQGGQPTEHDLNALTPETLRTHFADVWSALANDPTPQHAAAFLKQYQDYANGVTKDANQLIGEHAKRIINTHSELLTPEEQKTLTDNYINSLYSDSGVTPPDQGANVVKVQDPFGKIRAVPADKVKAALSAGGKLVQ